MSVTDEKPTKVGQRVQEIFSDSRGWVVGINLRTDEPTAVVEWDEPTELGDDDRVFPLDALRVVRVIRLDVDHFEDPATHPAIEYSYVGTGRRTRYVTRTGTVLMGRDAARLWLMGYQSTPTEV